MAFQVFGTRSAIRVTPPELWPFVRGVLPPGWVTSQITRDTASFSVSCVDGSYRVTGPEGWLVSTPDLDDALGALDARIRARIAFAAPHHIFVHAAAVAWHRHAIVIPGPSFSGKTTLAAALVAAGATYYSDEFAVLDQNGLVHPYPKPLSVRTSMPGASREYPVQAIGGKTGRAPIPVAVIVITQYQRDARWKPQCTTPGDGALALVASAIPIRDRPRQALSAIAAAATNALVLKSTRGEATRTAQTMLNAATEWSTDAQHDAHEIR